ncbi:MAG: PD-(D/E)XK nuclease family protein, partial [bacterium]|nr:PD-(D/E)XK nuclease family protein [bacterium]
MAYLFPEKIFPSALNHYLRCPFKFKCHNDKEIKAEFIEKPENFVGKVIHAVLKDFFDIKKTPIDKRKEQDIALMIKSAWARMEKNAWDKAYWTAEERRELFGSIEQEKAFGLDAIAMLNNYLLKADLSVVPLSLEDWMESDIDGFKIAGRIDRIDQDSNSAVSVWDYKTGKLPFHSSVEKIIEEDLQIPFYAIIASQLYPFAEKIRAGLIYLKYSKVYDAVWDKKEIKNLEKKVIEVLKQAKNDTGLLPRINKLCPYCEYL